MIQTIQQHSSLVQWDQPISLLLIDSLHDYANVARDFFQFEPWVAPGGYIAFHDYADYFPGVKAFVHEILGSGRYRKISLAHTMLIVQKQATTEMPQPEVEHTERLESVGFVMNLPVWIYWEGESPTWIDACRRTILAHASDVRIVTPADFEQMYDNDPDIDLSCLYVAHRADVVRAFLLARYGGLWIDSDCVVLRSLQPTIDALDTYDFLGYKERQGHISNSFIGARPGSVIASAYYQRICTILRSGQPRSWLSLGAHALTDTIQDVGIPWLRLGYELVQPICWSNPAAFFAINDRHEHDRVFNERSICIHIGDGAEIIARMSERWNLAIFGDVLEHWPKDTAQTVLSQARAFGLCARQHPDRTRLGARRYVRQPLRRTQIVLVAR